MAECIYRPSVPSPTFYGMNYPIILAILNWMRLWLCPTIYMALSQSIMRMVVAMGKTVATRKTGKTVETGKPVAMVETVETGKPGKPGKTVETTHALSLPYAIRPRHAIRPRYANNNCPQCPKPSDNNVSNTKGKKHYHPLLGRINRRFRGTRTVWDAILHGNLVFMTLLSVITVH